MYRREVSLYAGETTNAVRFFTEAETVAFGYRQSSDGKVCAFPHGHMDVQDKVRPEDKFLIKLASAATRDGGEMASFVKVFWSLL